MSTKLLELPVPDKDTAMTTSQRTMVAARLTMPDKPDQSEMMTATMLVTPQQAQAWLDAMPHQRRIRQNKIDHIVPLVAGGTDDRANLQATCPTCNSRKHDKDPLTFARELGLLL